MLKKNSKGYVPSPATTKVLPTSLVDFCRFSCHLMPTPAKKHHVRETKLGVLTPCSSTVNATYVILKLAIL